MFQMIDENPGKDIKWRLKTKLLISILLLEAMLMTAIILVVEHQMRESILDEFLKRGLSVTRNLAAVNNDFVTTYNYVKVELNLEWVVKENGLLYATVVFFDGEVAGYKGLDEYRKSVLEGPLHRNTLGIEDTVIQYDSVGSEAFCDIAVPILLSGENWGTVRAGFSLKDLHRAVINTRLTLLILGLLGLGCGYLASVLLARRITRPIGQLVESVKAVSQGHYDQAIRINTQDEIGYLGQRFSMMREALKDHFQLLAETNRRLVTSNKELQREIAERRRKEEQIRYLAFYDTVTGLPNRALLKEHLERVLQQSKRYHRAAAILFLDLDHFKRINDTLGHNAGDELLQEVANRLADYIRECDYLTRPAAEELQGGNTVARLGGDEFVILLTELHDAEEASRVAKRVLEVLAMPFTLQKTQVYVTASIGISSFPNDGDDAETLLKQADTAMYHAKAQGRNDYQYFAASMNVRVQERLSLENDLRESILRDDFVLYYQPKADTRTGRITGMEALVRWIHPVRGFVSPGEFIPVSEESGLIVPLGEWVLRKACTQAKAWQEAGLPPLHVSVNLSVAQFKQPGLKETVIRALQDSGLAPEYLELELTESLLMENLETSIKQLHELKAIGIQLSIDDFGTGYSSLSYLKRFPIDTLKIDRAFIRDVTNNNDDAVIVQAIVTLGHSLHLKVVAEGVEDEHQLAFLGRHGCDLIQGFLLSKPIDPEAFQRFIEERVSAATPPRPHAWEARERPKLSVA